MPIGSKIHPDVRKILGRLTDAGHEAYIVGGAVRDLLLGIEPKDYDIATSATPEEVKRVFGRRSRIIGRRFRLVHVYLGNTIYEVCTFRREPTAEERKGRPDDDGLMIWRDNAFGTLEQDAHRRDFTVNALYYDAIGGRGVIDLVGGMADIESRTVRCIGPTEVRLREDPVRMLRACKLAAQYDFRFSPELGAAISVLAPGIALSSRTRLFEEILKILAKPWSFRTFAVLYETRLLEAMWPGMAAMWRSPRGGFLQALLRARDRRLAAGGYSRSKILGLATMALPAVEARLNPGCAAGELWPHRPGLERVCRETVTSFFSPFRVSRYFSARARDMLLLVSQFQGPVRGRLLCHPEYRYGRELASLVLEACGRDRSEFESQWPERGTGERAKKSGKPGGSRGRRRRGGGAKNRARPAGPATEE